MHQILQNPRPNPTINISIFFAAKFLPNLSIVQLLTCVTHVLAYCKFFFTQISIMFVHHRTDETENERRLRHPKLGQQRWRERCQGERRRRGRRSCLCPRGRQGRPRLSLGGRWLGGRGRPFRISHRHLTRVWQLTKLFLVCSSGQKTMDFAFSANSCDSDLDLVFCFASG